jgi:CheY-like chemotaxis protein
MHSDLVLVCDDEAANRMIFRAALEIAGCQVAEANLKGQAVKGPHSLAPSLVLLRVRNAGTARDALELFQESSGFRDVPVVAVSSNIYVREKELEEAGYLAYIRMPVSPYELAAAVSRCLEVLQPGAYPGWIYLR